MPQGPRIGRRRLLALAAGSGAVAAGGLVTPASAEEPIEPNPQAVYVTETGHHISGRILDWWLQYGRESAIGWPITEPLNYGREQLQYFERGALLTDAWTRDPLGVIPLNLGTAWALQQVSADQPHDYGWWFPQTKRGVHPVFWEPFREGGGVFAFGFPVLWGAETTSGLRQVFSRSIWRDTSQGLVQDPVGTYVAELRGVSTAPVRQSVVAPPYDAAHWPTRSVYPSKRRAEVDLTRQVTTFFADDQPVYQALISTGLPPDFTPPGDFEIFWRIERARLISNGSTVKTYDVPNVLHVQYFTQSWIGFHYAYWHDAFGSVYSAGCVNMRLHDSQWAWDFCANGTPVTVHH